MRTKKVSVVVQEHFPDPTIRELADRLHFASCGWNHTDGCGYVYEHWDGGRLDPNSRICYTWDLHKKAYDAAKGMV